MIDGLLGQTSLPAIGNLANAETPGFRPVDVDPRAFQAALRDSIEQRALDQDGRLTLDDGAPVAFSHAGVELKPEVLADNILFHDGNDRSVERLLQRVTENVYAFRAASQLLRGQFETINAAIRERP
jgi:flagellar basal body rod protein FlgB